MSIHFFLIPSIGMVSRGLTGEDDIGFEEATRNRFKPSLGVRKRGILTLHDVGKEIFEVNEDQDLVVGDRGGICVPEWRVDGDG